ncbi:mechanosensitive ion channel family protein [Asticcacaulis sp. SL142]|uniref:mechanosensitive ion channel family protein n=1 Tax=Asticcacaulis sp. SL142 TaxID=2995155 RepID=UPI00226CDC6C|nr:mechanosensitive ion channel family protein [Asticcacaulis sp. SL142]WAC49881.1 mechanosensitive ion channel family protein [Asticcacaulis sp. SL142]
MNILRDYIPHWLIVVGAAVLFLLIGLLVARLLMASARKLASLNASAPYQFNVHRLRRPLYMVIPLLMAIIAVRLTWPEASANPFYEGVIKILAVSFVYWLAVSIVGMVSAAVMRRYDVNVRDNLRARRIQTRIVVVRRIVSFLLFLIALAAVFMMFESLRGLGVSLLASAGMAGLIIGFAAQKTLGNLLAGIQIAIAQPIRMGDAVVVEGEWGWIEEITLTYVVIRIWDLRRLVLPISYFIEKPFQNWTRNSADIIGSVELFADYSLPIEPLRAELVRILNETKLWDQKVQVVQVTEAERDVIKIRILVSAADSPTAWDLRCLVREKMVGFIHANYPHCLPKTRALLEPMETDARILPH